MTPQLQPPAVLNFGAPGSGKTHALSTLLQSGLKVFVISTEPDGISSLLDACESKKLPLDNLHWASCLPHVPGWSALKEMVRQVGAMGYEDLAKIKSGIGKADTHKAAMRFLNSVEDFVCERTGNHYGDVTSYDDSCAVVIDSMSGLNTISMMAAAGHKPTLHQGEWGIAMNFVETLILKLCSDRNCFLVITGHVEKETNELTGASQLMISSIGRKLAPKLPRFFSEVVYSKRTMQGASPTFIWSTADAGADLKNRVLPVSAALLQDYGPIVDAYRKRKARAAASPPTAQTTPSTPTERILPSAPMRPTPTAA